MQYYVAVSGQQFGPFTREQLLAQPPPEGALVWREGLSQWAPVTQLPELQLLLQPYSGPPPPVAAFHSSRPPTSPSQASASRLPTGMQASLSWNELRKIAQSQRRLILGLGASGLVYLLGLPAISVLVTVFGSAAGLQEDAVGVIDALAEWTIIFLLCGIQAGLAVGLAQSLRLANVWLWGIGSCLCCVGLIVLLVLNQKATTTLQQAGIRVGFLGAVLPERSPR